jgi:hypothetical protein
MALILEVNAPGRNETRRGVFLRFNPNLFLNQPD